MTVQTVKTTCPYCGVGCGVDIAIDKDGAVSVRGDKQHPANFGRLCSKGAALAETLGPEGRLSRPQINGEAVSWDSALQHVAQTFKDIVEEHGADAVAFYVSGQLLTEDYYVANKLMKGFIGSGNIDTNSRLCMSSSVAGHKRAFGSDTVPGNYEDLELADLIVLTGSNLAWCHPVLYQRIVVAKRARPDMRVVVLDPRRTATCDIADLHLPLQPGADAVLFNGLLVYLAEHGCRDHAFVEQHTDGVEQALHQARWSSPDIATVAARCGVAAADVQRLYQWFAEREQSVTVYSQGINQTSSGTDKVNAIINCHLFAGRIGRPGMGPFSVTGQPNAMGGREVGALSNQLASHMEIDNAEHRRLVGDFWQSDRVTGSAGLKAVDMFRAVEDGRIKAIWIMATNPAVSVPDNSQVRRALAKCEHVVVSDCVHTDTSGFANVLLPVRTWAEKEGTVTNSERRISRQRAFMDAPGEAMPDWWLLSQVAQRMGFAGFDYENPAQIFDEYARLCAHENHGSRDLDLSGLVGLDAGAYDQLQPCQWPLKADGASDERLFAEGGFFTADRRARFVAVAPRAPAEPLSGEFPWVLNTGRVRDHWHTMTRTGRSPRLSAHITEPYAELHPDDAQRLGIEGNDLVGVRSAWGEVLVRARIDDAQRPGSVFVPMHWNQRFASQALVDSVANPHTDPLSGQPEFKHTPVQLQRYAASWYGFVLSREPLEGLNMRYWSATRRLGVWHYELAGDEAMADWAGFARSLLCTQDQAQWSELLDTAGQQYRAARFVDGRLVASIFISTANELPPRDWLVGLFREPQLDAKQRMRVLAGSPGSGQEDVGRIICSCFSVGINTLIRAIREKHYATPEEIGAALRAGTNCGSCVPELRGLIEQVQGEPASAE